MCLVRLDNHVESVNQIIAGLEAGTRTLTSLQVAMLLRELDEALQACQGSPILTHALGLNPSMVS
jgi:hypothetical protein